MAQAAVEFDKKSRSYLSIYQWRAEQQERITAAEAVLTKLPPEEQPRQRHRIAGLKAALRKGRDRLSKIAGVAAGTRRAIRQVEITPPLDR